MTGTALGMMNDESGMLKMCNRDGDGDPGRRMKPRLGPLSWAVGRDRGRGPVAAPAVCHCSCPWILPLTLFLSLSAATES